LKDVPFSAYILEFAPLTFNSTLEFVILDTPELKGVRADMSQFSHYLRGDDVLCNTFSNSTGDAKTVAPGHLGYQRYPHIASFMRRAQNDQKSALWRSVATELLWRIEKYKDWKLFVSTGSKNVHWAHARIERCPKYLRYASFL